MLKLNMFLCKIRLTTLFSTVWTNRIKTCNPHEMTGDNYCDEEDPSGNGDNLGEYLIT